MVCLNTEDLYFTSNKILFCEQLHTMQIGQDFLDIIQIVHLIRMLPFRKQLQAIWKTEKKKNQMEPVVWPYTIHNLSVSLLNIIGNPV